MQGPRTLEGKACVAMNAIKHGAYAQAENVRREIMVRRGEDPAEYEQLHQDLVDSCPPEDALQAMVVKTISDKTWDKLKLRRTLLEAQLGSVQLEEVRLRRRQLRARRWPVDAHPGGDQGLCGSKDSPDKFNPVLQHLDRLQEWFEKEECMNIPTLWASFTANVPLRQASRSGSGLSSSSITIKPNAKRLGRNCHSGSRRNGATFSRTASCTIAR